MDIMDTERRINGELRYGPPPSWTGAPPLRGCEIIVKGVPRSCSNEELIEFFSIPGPIYCARIKIDFSGLNRGYAFATYATRHTAKRALDLLPRIEVRRRNLCVSLSVDNRRLLLGGVVDNIEVIYEKLVALLIQQQLLLMFVEKTEQGPVLRFRDHQMASQARRSLFEVVPQLWGEHAVVEWAGPEDDVLEMEEGPKFVNVGAMLPTSIRYPLRKDNFVNVGAMMPKSFYRMF